MDMPFTNEDADTLAEVLNTINQCSRPLEVFDVFLHEYRNGASAVEAMDSALDEWDE